ncbi:hypothetical protein SDC9_194760 [bioreactor metagenome]|uniref:Uncharacterized protein n=1 Tax=bioreactor metagenome TaxID=1076179 RepID=A0A645I9Q6_9ZZZZ
MMIPDKSKPMETTPGLAPITLPSVVDSKIPNM